MDAETSKKAPSAHGQAVIDSSYQNMLQGLDPAVAARVSGMWDADQRKYFDAVREQTAGKSAHEWGSSNCKKCYGRGYTGILLHTANKVTCKCAKKNYQKWLQAFRVEFNASRDEQNHATDEQTQTTGGSEDTQEALTDSETPS